MTTLARYKALLAQRANAEKELQPLKRAWRLLRLREHAERLSADGGAAPVWCSECETVQVDPDVSFWCAGRCLKAATARDKDEELGGAIREPEYRCRHCRRRASNMPKVPVFGDWADEVTPRMFYVCSEPCWRSLPVDQDAPPDFSQVQYVIPQPTPNGVPTPVSVGTTATAENVADLILALLRGEPEGLALRQIAERLNRPYPTIVSAIRKLHAQGRVVEPETCGGTWRVAQ